MALQILGWATELWRKVRDLQNYKIPRDCQDYSIPLEPIKICFRAVLSMTFRIRKWISLAFTIGDHLTFKQRFFWSTCQAERRIVAGTRNSMWTSSTCCTDCWSKCVSCSAHIPKRCYRHCGFPELLFVKKRACVESLQSRRSTIKHIFFSNLRVLAARSVYYY